MGAAQPSSTSQSPSFSELLTERNIAAFKIQSFWRLRYAEMLKARQVRISARPYAHFRILEEHFKPLIQIFYSSIALNINEESRTREAEHICNSNHFRFKMRDLNNSTKNQKKLQIYLSIAFRDQLPDDPSGKIQFRDFGLSFPIIVINEVVIGSGQEFQDLVDEGALVRIYQGEYLRKCMKCKTLRKNLQSQSCNSCLLRYEWFKVESKQKQIKKKINLINFLESVKQREEQEQFEEGEEDKDPARFTMA